jgi:hypothetical protein
MAGTYDFAQRLNLCWHTGAGRFKRIFVESFSSSRNGQHSESAGNVDCAILVLVFVVLIVVRWRVAALVGKCRTRL